MLHGAPKKLVRCMGLNGPSRCFGTGCRLWAIRYAAPRSELHKLRELQQVLDVDPRQAFCECFSPALSDLEVGALRRFKQASLNEIALRPMDAVRESGLFSTGQELLSVLIGYKHDAVKELYQRKMAAINRSCLGQWQFRLYKDDYC